MQPHPPTDDRCSDAALLRGDAPRGTAPVASRWLLLEQDGKWAADVRASVQAPPGALAALDAALAAASGRLELIRRHARRPDRTDAPRWCVVDARLGVEVWGTRDADGGWGGALDALGDPLASAESAAVGVDTPAHSDGSAARGLLLVCTHGRHDQCCALKGRGVAAALAEAYPDQTWECTHLGGDRFAANVAVMPDGVLYGYVPADKAVDLIAAHRRGTSDRAHVRGVVGRTPHEQAALVAASHALDVAPWDRRLTACEHDTTEGWRVEISLEGRRLDVRGHDELAPPALLTCAAMAPKRALVPVVDAVAP
jgi:hypothetical protein